jgi:dolichyl-phosphate-mannose--protein O-mannosyl transferase
MIAAESRRTLVSCLVFAALAASVRLPRLGFPPEEMFDEVYHAKAAREYLEGAPPNEWVHPPMAKWIIAIGIDRFGYEAWAWRLTAALAGVALAPVFFLLAREALPTARAAGLATLLLLCDGVCLVQSRIAMTNVFAVLFQVLAALFLLRAVRREVLPAAETLMGGMALGLALSTRWTSLWALGFLGLVALAGRRRRLLRPRELGLLVLAFAAVPLCIYVLSYLPLTYLRPGLPPWQTWRDLVEIQKEVWRYHANLQADHPYFSKWYTWPLLYRPTWYYFKDLGAEVRGIVAIGNPALWWASVPVTAWALVTGARDRDWRRLFAGAGFCCLFLPWGISPRTLNYSHYLFEAIPHACLALGLLLDRAWDRSWAARAYVLATILLFLFFLPLLLAWSVPRTLFYGLDGGVRWWTWFPTWV